MGGTHRSAGSKRKPTPLGSGVGPRAKEGSSELQGDPPSPFFLPPPSLRHLHPRTHRLALQRPTPLSSQKLRPPCASSEGNEHMTSSMTRCLTTLFAGLLIAGAGEAADAKKVTIHWHGQSFFDI